MALSTRVFGALLLGLAIGMILAANSVTAMEMTLTIAVPVGRLWLDALTMTVVPLVFGLLVTGITGAAETASAGGVARRALLWFAVLLVGCCAVSALLASSLLTAWPVSVQPALLTGPGTTAPVLKPASDWVTGIIPTNPIKAAADTAMVPLIVFALLFGFAMVRIDTALRLSLMTVFRAIVEVMLVIVQWVLRLAPIGVFALALGVGARLGAGAVGTLFQYLCIVAACCLSAAMLTALIAIIFGRMSTLGFLRAALPAQMVAISTQSSLASLPAMVEAAPALGIERSAIGVVLPMAVSLFRAASAAANVAVAIYLAHLHAVPLTPVTIAVGVVTAAVVSLAAVGLPAQVSFFATIGPVCLALGVPLSFLPVLLAVETIPDIFRTFGNVTADLAVARLAGTASKTTES